MEKVMGSFNGSLSKVFLHVSGGLFITGITSYITAMVNFASNIGIVGYIILFLMMLILGLFVCSNNKVVSGISYYVFSLVGGILISSIHIIECTGTPIITALVITSVLFVAMIVLGLLSNRNFGTYFLISLIGIIVVSLASIFLMKSLLISALVSAVFVIVFLGLTMFDAHRLVSIVNTEHNEFFGALLLHLDFLCILLAITVIIE